MLSSHSCFGPSFTSTCDGSLTNSIEPRAFHDVHHESTTSRHRPRRPRASLTSAARPNTSPSNPKQQQQQFPLLIILTSILEQQTVPTRQQDLPARPARPRQLPRRLTIVHHPVDDAAAALTATSCCCIIIFVPKRLQRLRDHPQHSLHFLHEFNTASSRCQRPHLDDKLQLLANAATVNSGSTRSIDSRLVQ